MTILKKSDKMYKVEKMEENKNSEVDNMKERYGFTLIELLAVIVILAVIALIATPVILGIIDDAKKVRSKIQLMG